MLRRAPHPQSSRLRQAATQVLSVRLLALKATRHSAVRVHQVIDHSPKMPLMLQQNFSVKLLEMLRAGALGCAILAEPFPDTRLEIAPL